MRKLLLLAALLIAGASTIWAQNYTTTAQAITDDPEWMDYLWCDDYYAPNPSPEVAVFDDFIIVKSWCNAQGYDMKIEFNSDDQVTALTSIVNGVEGERKDAGYVPMPTPDNTVYFYIARNFAFAGTDSEGGAVVMSCYIGSDNATYYLYELAFEATAQTPAVTPEGLLYTATAEAVTDDPDWMDYLWCDDYYAPNPSPEVEVYDNYLIVKSWCNAQGYDMKIEFNSDDQITALTSIVNGVEGERKDAGYVPMPTPDNTVYFYIARNFAFAGTDSEGGTVLMSCYIGSDNATYYLYELTFEAPAQGSEALLYTATAEAVTDDPEWYDYLWCDGYYVPNASPKVEVYEGSMIVKNWCGADGYDMKIEYNDDDQVTALTSIVNGVEGERKDAGYVAMPTPEGSVSFYIARNFAYAGADMEGGYVLMSCFKEGDNATFYLYELTFEAPTTGVNTVINPENTVTEYFIIGGIKVATPTTPGLYIMRQGNKTSKVIVR